MYLISHRGNLNGPKPNLENSVPYIDKAISENFDVEIDLWLLDENLYLGHDNPENRIQFDWLNHNRARLWVHCKNIDALLYLKDKDDFNYFFHDSDFYTLTSKKFIWAHPNAKNFHNTIMVMPEKTTHNFDIIRTQNILGICSDYIVKFND